MIESVTQGQHAVYGVVRHGDFDGFVLHNIQIGLAFQKMFESKLIHFFIALHARRMNRRPFAGVEHMIVQGGIIGHAAHRSAQCVNFAHNLPLGNPANGRIARHLGNGVQALG